MNIFQLSISTFVFAVTLLLGTTAVIASRFVVTTVATLYKPAAVPDRVAAPTAQPERVVDLPDLRNDSPSAPDDFDPTGSYYLANEKVPAAFADIEYIDITTREYGDENGTYFSRPIVPTGSLRTQKRFEFSKISFGNREISFETDLHDGISYQFVGTFPVATEYVTCEGCEYPADLKGRLKKLKNGKVIAEVQAEFYINGC